MSNKGNILKYFFNTPEEYINLKIGVSERVLDVVDILVENRPTIILETPSTSDPGPPKLGGDGLPLKQLMTIGAADLPQAEKDELVDAIMDNWAAGRVEAIRAMPPDDVRLVFGVGFFDSFKVDWISTILEDMGITGKITNQIMSQMVLHVGHDRWFDVIANWKNPCECLSDLDNKTGQRGCDVIATGILKGIMYSIVHSATPLSAKKFTQIFKANPVIFASIFAGSYKNRLMQSIAQAGISDAMATPEAIAAKDAIVSRICDLDDPMDIMNIKWEDFEELIKDAVPGAEIPGAPESDKPDGGAPPSGGGKPSPGPGKPAEPTDELERGEPKVPPGEKDGELTRESIRKDESSLKVRGFKGYGSTHAIIDRKPWNLGTSKVQDMENNMLVGKSKDNNNVKDLVKVSRAFSKGKKVTK